MRKVFLLVVCCLLFATPALAAQGPYIGAAAGGTWLDDDAADAGYNVMIQLGRNYRPNLRFEGEFAYRENNLGATAADGTAIDGDIGTFSVMFNGYYDFPQIDLQQMGSLQPFVGIGIGGANVDYDAKALGSSLADSSDTVIAYQGILGVAYPLSKWLKLDLSYRYFRTQDAKLRDINNEPFDVEYETHNVSIGLRYDFY